MRVSFQRDTEGDRRRTVGLGSPEYTVGCPGCDGRSYRHLLKCQQKRTELGFSASSSLRDVMGDVVMEEAPPLPPPAGPPPVWRTSDETDAMTLAAVHPYGHEEPWLSAGQSLNHS